MAESYKTKWIHHRPQCTGFHPWRSRNLASLVGSGAPPPQFGGGGSKKTSKIPTKKQFYYPPGELKLSHLKGSSLKMSLLFHSGWDSQEKNHQHPFVESILGEVGNHKESLSIHHLLKGKRRRHEVGFRLHSWKIKSVWDECPPFTSTQKMVVFTSKNHGSHHLFTSKNHGSHYLVRPRL